MRNTTKSQLIRELSDFYLIKITLVLIPAYKAMKMYNAEKVGKEIKKIVLDFREGLKEIITKYDIQ